MTTPTMTECPTCHGDGVVRSDESEPAQPTDGLSEADGLLQALALQVDVTEECNAKADLEIAALRAEVERLRATIDRWREEFDAVGQATPDLVDALAESRAEVERLRAELSAYDEAASLVEDALRDRVRVLETAARKALGAVSIERIRGLLDRALDRTQEPPAKEPTP